MTLIRRLETVAIATAVLLPALGSALAGRWLLLFLFLTAGGVWLGRRWLPWQLATLIFLALTLLLAISAGLEVGAGWLLLGMAGALAGWDLDAFAGRLSHVAGAEIEAVLVRRHLQRLSLVLLLSLVLGGAALLVQMELSYGILLILVVSALVFLSRSASLLLVNRGG
jgi:hypothetical protein